MSRNEFYQGFAVALGALARNGYPSMAVDIMRTNGVSLKQLERAGCDDFDLGPLREELMPVGELKTSAAIDRQFPPDITPGKR